VKIKEAEKGLFLFQFGHELDMEGVLQGGPWTFDNRMLIVGRVQLGVQIENIPLNHVNFWVQVHNLPAGLMVEKVGRALANYIGSFVEYDKNNNSSFWRKYMRIRVCVDVRHPLKKNKKVKSQGGDWCTVNFKYEKLGVFCFVCGIMGHAENKCEVRFSMERDDGNREWSSELRAESRRLSGRPTSRWLKEEGGGSRVTGGRNNTDSEFTASGPQPNNHSMQSQFLNQNSPVSVESESAIITIPPVSAITSVTIPSVSVNQHNLSQLLPQPNSLNPITSNLTVTYSLPHNDQAHPLRDNHQPPNNISAPDNVISEQIANNDPNKTFIKHLSTNNNSAFTSLTFSPIITDTIKQQSIFSFQSPQMAHIDQINNPITRHIKPNPNHKLNRTSPNPNQISPKNKPSDS
jgi:14-3-3 protein epsilon